MPWLLKVRRIRKSMEVFMVTKPHWFFGHFRQHPGPNQAGLLKFTEWAEKSVGCFCLIYPLRPTLVLCHPDTLKILLKTNAPKGGFPDTDWSYWLTDPWLGNGLLTSNGTKWARNRRLLTPGFHFDVLKPYVQIFNECVETLMSKLDMESQKGDSVEIFKPVSLCTLNAITRCAFSSTEDVQTVGESSPYVKCVLDLSKFIVKRMFQPLFLSDIIYYKFSQDGKDFLKRCQFSHGIANKCISKRHKALQENQSMLDHRHKDFLDILLLAKDDSGQGLSDKEILDEVETFMFEGHDTTASGLSWCLYNLARHPEYQSKAREEVDKVMENQTRVLWGDLTNLPYLTMCIKESLRLYPPVAFVQRLLDEPTTFQGQTLEAGSPIDVNIWCAHHNKHVWGEDHMTYKPQRFSANNVAKMDSYAFIPFSAGPRNCIGQVFVMNELKVSLARLVHKFEFTVDPTHNVEMVPELILRPKYGIKLFLKKRF